MNFPSSPPIKPEVNLNDFEIPPWVNSALSNDETSLLDNDHSESSLTIIQRLSRSLGGVAISANGFGLTYYSAFNEGFISDLAGTYGAFELIGGVTYAAWHSCNALVGITEKIYGITHLDNRDNL